LRIKTVYIAGSLGNKQIPHFANYLTKAGFEVFADWHAPGPHADRNLRNYAKIRGWNYKQTLESYAGRLVYTFDKKHLDRCDAIVVLMPAGKSAMLELGYTRGREKPGFILFDHEPERVDIMFSFSSALCFSRKELVQALRKYKGEK
jgi:nucleoside 2-deoxyribosyltransferase